MVPNDILQIFEIMKPIERFVFQLLKIVKKFKCSHIYPCYTVLTNSYMKKEVLTLAIGDF